MSTLLNEPTLWDMPTIEHAPPDMLDPHREWIAQLSTTERTIFDTAYALYHALNVPGGCYHNSFFLHYYLKKRFHIDGHIEVGFINDGMGTRYASHAWYVYKNTITDLAISRPYNPTQNRIGPLTILGRTIFEGWEWSYHNEMSPEGFKATAQLLTCASDNPYDMISNAKSTHILMSKTAQSSVGLRAYLDSSPRGMTYHDLIEKIALRQAIPRA